MTDKETGPGRRTLWHKLAEVQGELEALPKDARADIQTSGGGSYSYEYVTESALMGAVRQKLAQRGVAVSVSWTGVEFQGNLAVVRGVMFFTNGDDPTQREAVQLLGTGTDKGDKAIYKAMTGAVRYALWKTFLIPAGVDNEQTNEPRSQGEAAPAEPSPQAAQRIASIEKRIARLAELFETSIAKAESRFQAAVDRESSEKGYGAKPWRQLPVGAMGEWIGRLDALGKERLEQKAMQEIDRSVGGTATSEFTPPDWAADQGWDDAS